ncbi:MAG TPA: hypothetical protein ENN06_03150 [Desulfobacteraceae bacterium]|nr:hypothetical protein [Desulfobacteraceae bacterium]
MIAGIHSRMLRSQTVSVGMRQQVASRSDWVISKRLARLVTLILCVSLFVLFAFGQLMHWQIKSAVNRIDRLQSVRSQYGSENIALLASRAQLTAEEYIIAEAGRKYQLVPPREDQVRRL